MLKNSFMNDVLYINSNFSIITFLSVRLSTTTLALRLCMSHVLTYPFFFTDSYLVMFPKELNIYHIKFITAFIRAPYSRLMGLISQQWSDLVMCEAMFYYFCLSLTLDEDPVGRKFRRSKFLFCFIFVVCC